MTIKQRTTKPVPFRDVAHDRLTAKGYRPAGVTPGYYWSETKRASVVLKNKHTLDTFAGHPQQVCAILHQDGGEFSLVSQDFYDLK